MHASHILCTFKMHNEYAAFTGRACLSLDEGAQDKSLMRFPRRLLFQ